VPESHDRDAVDEQTACGAPMHDFFAADLSRRTIGIHLPNFQTRLRFAGLDIRVKAASYDGGLIFANSIRDFGG
jgi:hypothetical protein